ncbi:MAG: hypothetical protein GX556_10485 [Fibrobacter sp.]|nr:hypothetical protein [Fibrobacter sp.]
MKFKSDCFYSFICISAAMFLLTGCGGEIYTETTYGGSFLIDSLTVGFIKTVNIQRESANAWDGGEYIDGEQTLEIYSVPQKRITKSIRIASGSKASLMGPAMTVTFSSPWMMYENDVDIFLFNINTREKIKIASSVFYFGGLSPDGQYAFYNKGDKRVEGGKIPGTTYFYSTAEKRVVDSVPLSPVIYLAENADFYLFTIPIDPLLNTKVKWVVRSNLTSNPPENCDTIYTIPDSLWFGNMTDFQTVINLVNLDSWTPSYYSFSSFLNKNLYPVYPLEQKIFKNLGKQVHVTFSTGIYTYGAGDVYIGGIYGDYQDTIFQSGRNWE